MRTQTSLGGLLLLLFLLTVFPVFTPEAQVKSGHTSGPPTVEEVKATLEESFTNAYQNHFFGVKNEVTFEWTGPVLIGASQDLRALLKPCYPAKLKVSVTAKDPRDGNISVSRRGVEAKIGGFLKKEIFCFYRDGFNEWQYATYEP